MSVTSPKKDETHEADKIGLTRARQWRPEKSWPRGAPSCPLNDKAPPKNESGCLLPAALGTSDCAAGRSIFF